MRRPPWASGKYAGTSVAELKRLKELETENVKLKRMYAELALENAASEGQPTETTDSQGSVTFTGVVPLTARAEKPGYVGAEQVVYGETSQIPLYNEWPREIYRTAAMLQVDLQTIKLTIAEELYDAGIAGFYACPNIFILRREDRLISADMVHELFHRWQDNRIGPRCSSISRNWGTTPFARKYQAAWDQDELERGRSVIDVNQRILKENAPQAFEQWTRSNHLHDYPRTFCDKAKLRCELFEEEFGPRPNSFP